MKIINCYFVFFVFLTTAFVDVNNKITKTHKFENAFNDEIILDKKFDTTIINYFGKHKIKYCEMIWLLANYKYLKIKSINAYMFYNLHRIIMPLENKTCIKGTYKIIGGFLGYSRFEYEIDDDLYKDLYNWSEKLNCVFDDETQLLINLSQDIQYHQKRLILFNDSVYFPLKWIDTNFIIPKKNIFNNTDELRKFHQSDSNIYNPIKIIYYNNPQYFNYKTIKTIEINDIDSIVKHINNLRLKYNIDPSIKKNIKVYFSDSSNQFQIQIK